MKIKHKRFGFTGLVLNTQGEFYDIRWDKRPSVLFNGGVKESLVLKIEVEEVEDNEIENVYHYDYDF